jgi:acyl-coenzyme A synthetase/AMP-(fatty) acid ligase
MTRPTSLSCTEEYVALHAAERPSAFVMINSGRAVTYGEFAGDIGRCAAALRQFGVPSGGIAAVGCDDFYLHWVLLLAFERLNVGTASYHSGESAPGARELLSSVDFVLCEEHFATAGAVRHHAMTPDWVREMMAMPHDEGPSRIPGAPDDPVRVLRSSGTTGRPKRLVVTRRMYEPRMPVHAWHYGFTKDSRYLLTLPFSANPSYGAATGCLRTGGTVVAEPFEGGRGLAQVLARQRITHAMLQPIMLKQVLEDLPAGFVKPADLTVVSLGSALADELCERARERLATEVLDLFGCNEVGGVTRRLTSSHDKFAEVWPEIEVETVDDNDRPVASGAPGQLRIRNEGMVEGYVGEPELTQRHFRNGWFYPGDIAVLDGPRRLRIIGRSDDVLNIGGAKILPEDLEAIVMRRMSVADVGICSLPDPEGVEEVYVAVAGARHEHGELLARMRQAFEHHQLGSYKVVMVRAIPRNASGKLIRPVLKEIVAAAARRASGG